MAFSLSAPCTRGFPFVAARCMPPSCLGYPGHSFSMASHDGASTTPTRSPLGANGDSIHEKTLDLKFLPNWDTADMCCSTGDASHFLKSSKRRRRGSPPQTLRSWIIDHQIGRAARHFRYSCRIETDTPDQASPSICSPSSSSHTSAFLVLADAPVPSSSSRTTTPTRTSITKDQMIFTMLPHGLLHSLQCAQLP